MNVCVRLKTLHPLTAFTVPEISPGKCRCGEVFPFPKNLWWVYVSVQVHLQIEAASVHCKLRTGTFSATAALRDG